MSKIKEQLEKIRLQMLDLGLRGNTLLHYAPRLKSISIIDEKSVSIYDLLVSQNKSMTFLPKPKIYEDKESENVSTLAEDADEILPPIEEYLSEQKGDARFEDTHLQTNLSAEKLDLNLLKIENEAHTIFMERGIDVLFLAVGFLEWYEDSNSTIQRLAPLILIPVELGRTNTTAAFKVQYTGMEMAENETLYAKLKNDFKLQLPEWTEEFEIEAYFNEIQTIINKQSRWRIQTDKIELGFFSFGKYQMYKDLDVAKWPDPSKILQHSLMESLFEKGFLKDVEQANLESISESIKTPDKLALVKDADSSQTNAILGVMAGANMVIQGPPGTGKSQTITNIISEAIIRGKKVLFVAQKMAALEVVKNRLDECNLGDAVLELHSHKSRPRQILDSIQNTLYQEKPSVPDRYSQKKRLQEVRNLLDDYAAGVSNKLLGSGANYVQALGYFIKHRSHLDGIDEIEFNFESMRKWQKVDLDKLSLQLQAIENHLSKMGLVIQHPFKDAGIQEVSPVSQEKISMKLDTGIEMLQEINVNAGFLAKELQIQVIENFSNLEWLCRAAQRAIDAPRLVGIQVNTQDWVERSAIIEQALKAGEKACALRDELEKVFIPQAFTRDLLGIRAGLAGKVDKWWKIFSSDYRKAKSNLQALVKNTLPKDAKQYLRWVDDIMALQETDKLWKSQEILLSVLFGVQWQREKSDWNGLLALANWVFDLYEQIGKGELPETLKSLFHGGKDFIYLQNQLNIVKNRNEAWKDWVQSIDQMLLLRDTTKIKDHQNLKIGDAIIYLQEWKLALHELYSMARINCLCQDLINIGQKQIADRVVNWKYSPDKLTHFVWFCYWSGIVNSTYENSEILRKFDRIAHEGLITEFRILDKSNFSFSQENLVESLYNELPNRNAPGEMGILRQEINKKRRLLPVRKLLAQTGNAIQKIKPVFMMSPMSVATFLPQGTIEFDLVIFDEASQLTAPDAIGAIVRGRQVIVVGDSKQMPPSSFFGKSIELDDEDAENDLTADMESILSLFLAQGAPEKMLQWHYRSRHDSLIYTSNHQFYGGDLKVFPSSGSSTDATGLAFVYVPNCTYDKGITRTNIGEAKVVAQHVLQHTRTKPHLSLGVVAFSMAQKDAVLIQVEAMRRRHPEMESFFKRHETGEEFFVKNLENVQGDERDVIFISIGYGKTAQGFLSANFGPINKEGGERRLNVLISRAKQGMVVFSNFTGDELSTGIESPFGIKALKEFLLYAEKRQTSVPLETGREMDSPFEMAVCQAIIGLGYDVEPQVGTQGFYIDLAIRDPRKPGRYLLAVECDGASYHSSANARDRDRLRQCVLESLGWKFHRIWSTDWFRNAKQETQRLKECIENILKEVVNDVAADQNVIMRALQECESDKMHEVTKIERIKIETVERKIVEEYLAVNLNLLCNWTKYLDFSEIPTDKMHEAIKNVLEIEAPISKKVLIMRLIEAVGLSRAGNRIQTRVEEDANFLAKHKLCEIKGDFIWRCGQAEIKVRNRSNLPAAEKKLELIAPEEIRLAFEQTIEEAMTISISDCISEVANRLGFQRTTIQMREIFENEFKRLQKSRKVIVDGDIVKAK